MILQTFIQVLDEKDIILTAEVSFCQKYIVFQGTYPPFYIIYDIVNFNTIVKRSAAMYPENAIFLRSHGSSPLAFTENKKVHIHGETGHYLTLKTSFSPLSLFSIFATILKKVFTFAYSPTVLSYLNDSFSLQKIVSLPPESSIIDIASVNQYKESSFLLILTKNSIFLLNLQSFSLYLERKKEEKEHIPTDQKKSKEFKKEKTLTKKSKKNKTDSEKAILKDAFYRNLEFNSSIKDIIALEIEENPIKTIFFNKKLLVLTEYLNLFVLKIKSDSSKEKKEGEGKKSAVTLEQIKKISLEKEINELHAGSDVSGRLDLKALSERAFLVATPKGVLVMDEMFVVREKLVLDKIRYVTPIENTGCFILGNEGNNKVHIFYVKWAGLKPSWGEALEFVEVE